MKYVKLLWFVFFLPLFLISQNAKEYRFEEIRKVEDIIIDKSTKEELKKGTYKFIGFDPTKSWTSNKNLNGYVILSLNANQEFDGEFSKYSSQDDLLSDGNYSNGILHGKFKTYNLKGKVLTSLVYKKGKATGSIFEYGSMYHKKYSVKNDIKEGELILYYSGEIKEKGNYKDDELVGKYIVYHVGGGIKEEYEREKSHKVGVYKSYYRNGALETESKPTSPKNFESTIIGGEHQSRSYEHYFREGGLKYFEIYENGELIEEKKWWTNGNLMFAKKYIPVHLKYTEYRDTKENHVDYETYQPESTVKEFYDNGKLKKMVDYNQGIQDGWVKEYYKNGNLKEEYEANFNVKNGVHKKFSSNGTLIEESRLKMGLLMFNKLFDSIKNVKTPYYEFSRESNGDYTARGIQRRLDSLTQEEIFKNSTNELFEKTFNKKGHLIVQIQKRNDTLFGEVFSYRRPKNQRRNKNDGTKNSPVNVFDARHSMYSDKGVLISESIFEVDDSSWLAKMDEKGFLKRKKQTNFYDEKGKLMKIIGFNGGVHEEFVVNYDGNKKKHGLCKIRPYGQDFVFDINYKHGLITMVVKKTNSGLTKSLYNSNNDEFYDDITYEIQDSNFVLTLKNSKNNSQKIILRGRA